MLRQATSLSSRSASLPAIFIDRLGRNTYLCFVRRRCVAVSANLKRAPAGLTRRI